MTNRVILYSFVGVGILGTVALYFMDRIPLAIGWWLGAAIGGVNFQTLLLSLKRGQVQDPKASVTAKLRKNFFVRYAGLAAAFFLVIQLGKEQLGSALLGFLGLYLIFMVYYVIQLRKKRDQKGV